MLATLVACAPGANNAAVCAAFQGQRSGTEVIAAGTVVRLLGSAQGASGEHEAFSIRLSRGCALTLRVETNTAFTGTIPLRVGERIIVKGEFEYDADGGVVHWTHRALGAHHQSGYVQAGGRFYW